MSHKIEKNSAAKHLLLKKEGNKQPSSQQGGQISFPLPSEGGDRGGSSKSTGASKSSGSASSSPFLTADPTLYHTLKYYARENRKQMTEAEGIIWEYLRDRRLGKKFQRQYVIKDYIVDFVCLETNLIIEIDGGYHAEPIQMEDDTLRQSELRKLGYTVIRFKNDDVLFNIEKVIKQIKQLNK